MCVCDLYPTNLYRYIRCIEYPTNADAIRQKKCESQLNVAKRNLVFMLRRRRRLTFVLLSMLDCQKYNSKLFPQISTYFSPISQEPYSTTPNSFESLKFPFEHIFKEIGPADKPANIRISSWMLRK